jgi:hypothetical protein
MRSVYDSIKILASLVPATRTASANGSGVDTLGYTSAMAVILAGDIDTTDGNETYSFSVEEADTSGGTYTAISGATTTVTADNDVKVIRIDGLGQGSRKRFLRVVATFGGTTPSWPGSAHFALGRAYQEPVN